MNTEIKNFILKLTKEIGQIQITHFHPSELKTKTKSQYFSDVVTKVDRLAENLIIKKTKEFGFKGTIITEETGELKLGDSQQRFIVDPLDGTFFYSRNIHNFCVATALEENNQIVFSTVYNPYTDEFFYAEKNMGAFLNNKKIKVSNIKDLSKSTIILAGYPNYKLKTLEKIFSRLMSSGGFRLLMHLINLNLSYIATGRYDGLVGFYKILPEWDKIPGVFILEEAGGLITDFSGNTWNKKTTKFVASNRKLHKSLLKIVS